VGSRVVVFQQMCVDQESWRVVTAGVDGLYLWQFGADTTDGVNLATDVVTRHTE
jgi:hypothetical protein